METYQDKIIIFSGASSYHQDVWEFDLTNNTWSQKSLSGTIPSGRAWSADAIINNKIYMYMVDIVVTRMIFIV